MRRVTMVPLLLAGLTGLAPVVSAPAGLAAQARPGQQAQQGKRMAKQGEVRHSAFAIGNAQVITEFQAHPATQDPSRRVTQADLTAWAKSLSNWGRWGAAGITGAHPSIDRAVTDQRGTLNLITPQKTVAAARLVQTGRVVTLASFLGFNDFKDAVDTFEDVQGRWWPISVSPDGGVSANDAIEFGVHDGIITHMTALCHYWGLRTDPSSVPEYGSENGYAHQNSVFFNGYPYFVGESGCENLGIDRMGLEYTARGVLYDMPLLRKVDWLDPTTPIFVEDLEEWERFANVRAAAGDVMIVRTGRWAERAKEGAWYFDRGGAGLHASVLPWLKARDIAVLAGDGMNDVQPSGVAGVKRPIHQIGLVIIGLPLVNNTYTEDAAAVAQELKRWEFMVTWKNLDIPGGSGSPWNAVAVF